MTESHYWSTVCNQWEISSYCDNSTWTDRLQFQVDISMNHSESLGGCIFFHVTNAIFPNGQQHYPNCMDSKNAISTVCDMACESALINEIITQPTLSDDEVYGAYQFWLLFLFMVIAWMSQAIVVSVTDAVCFEMLGKFKSSDLTLLIVTSCLFS